MSPVLPTDPTARDYMTVAYLHNHPDVWALFCRFAFELIEAGRNHGGARRPTS